MTLDIEKLMADLRGLIQFLESETATYKLMYVMMHTLKDDKEFINSPETIEKLMGLRGIIDRFHVLKAEEDAKG